MTALGMPNLDTTYLRSPAGGPHVNLNATQGGVRFDGASLAAGTAGNAGPDYQRITRGATTVINCAYNATDGLALCYSGAPNGLDLGPTPSTPLESSVRVLTNKLRLIPQDRTLTSLPNGWIDWLSTVTMNFASATTGGMLRLGGVVEFQQSANLFGMGNALLHDATWKNVNGVAANLGPAFLFANNAVYQGDNASISMSQARIFFDNTRYEGANGGSITMSAAVGHCSLYASLTVNSGATIGLRRAVYVPDAFGTGTLTTQVGVDIERLNFAGTNIGIRSAMLSADGDFINSVGATAAARFGGEVEIDGALNHDGGTAGFLGAAPVARPNVTGSRGGNAALASLLTGLANLGLITDSTTA